MIWAESNRIEPVRPKPSRKFSFSFISNAKLISPLTSSPPLHRHCHHSATAATPLSLFFFLSFSLFFFSFFFFPFFLFLSFSFLVPAFLARQRQRSRAARHCHSATAPTTARQRSCSASSSSSPWPDRVAAPLLRLQQQHSFVKPTLPLQIGPPPASQQLCCPSSTPIGRLRLPPPLPVEFDHRQSLLLTRQASLGSSSALPGQNQS